MCLMGTSLNDACATFIGLSRSRVSLSPLDHVEDGLALPTLTEGGRRSVRLRGLNLSKHGGAKVRQLGALGEVPSAVTSS